MYTGMKPACFSFSHQYKACIFALSFLAFAADPIQSHKDSYPGNKTVMFHYL